ncbi:hypothetical protein D3C76_1005740 [compost metagenome]
MLEYPLPHDKLIVKANGIAGEPSDLTHNAVGWVVEIKLDIGIFLQQRTDIRIKIALYLLNAFLVSTVIQLLVTSH